jgi:anti-sigma factor RsiW
MSAEQNISPEEFELLSAYLDNMLNEAERSALELRLADSAPLRAELEALRATIALINGLPTLKAPRNFILTPEMVKSKTEVGAPQLLKTKTEGGAPQLVKTKTEVGRIIRFPISSVMSAAAAFVIIILGMVLIVGDQSAPQTSMSLEGSVALMVTNTSPAEAMSDLALAQESPADDSSSPDTSAQRGAMPTPTLNATYAGAGMMAQPTATEEVFAELAMQPANQADVPPAPVQSENIQTTQLAPVMPMPMPTLSATQMVEEEMPIIASVPADDQEAMDTMTFAYIEETPVTEFFEILGNAIPPTEIIAVIETATPSETPSPVAPKADEPASESVNITSFIGMALIAIGIISLIVVVWRGRKG